MKSKLLILPFFAAVLLSGCSASMQANEVRTRLNECSQAQLDNIVYMRPDKSVLNVICTPKADEIDNTVTVKHPVLFALSPTHVKPALPPLTPVK